MELRADSDGIGNALPNIILAGAKADEEDNNNSMVGGGGAMGGILADGDGGVEGTQHNMSSYFLEAPEFGDVEGLKQEGDRNDVEPVRDSVDLLSQDFPKYQFRRG